VASPAVTRRAKPQICAISEMRSHCQYLTPLLIVFGPLNDPMHDGTNPTRRKASHGRNFSALLHFLENLIHVRIFINNELSRPKANRTNRNGEGHDDVMQTRSIRGSGEPGLVPPRTLGLGRGVPRPSKFLRH
jgi:hypothetical protein